MLIIIRKELKIVKRGKIDALQLMVIGTLIEAI